MILFSSLLVLCFHFVLVLGQCGFPGRPLNAKVYIFGSSIKPGRGLLNSSVIPPVDPPTFERETSSDSNDSTDTHSNVTSLKESYSEYNKEISETTWNNEKLVKGEISETSWNNEELHRVMYRCDNDLLMGDDGRNDYYRKCIDGHWTVEIPQCVGTTKISEILQNDETLKTDKQGMLSACTSFSQNEPLMLYLPDKRRLSGIRITSGADNTVQRFQKANFSFVGDDAVPQITYQRKNFNDSVSLFVFTNLTEEMSVLSIKLASTRSFNVCQLEIYALPDQCGHPEIPINGTVIWQRGSPNATYSCQEGYSLEPSTETRTCERGKWLGSEPLCRLKGIKETEDPALTTAQTPLMIVIIVAAISVVVVGIVLFSLYKKNLLCQNNCDGRKGSFRNKPRDVDAGTDQLINEKSESEGVQHRKGVNQSDQNVTIEDQLEGSHAIRSSEQSDPGSLIYATCLYAEQSRKSYSSRSSVQSNQYASPNEQLHSMSRHSGNQSNFERTPTNEESKLEPVYSVVNKSNKTSKTTLPKD